MTHRGVVEVVCVLWLCTAGAGCGDDPAPVDSDGDGLSDQQEGVLGTDPNQVDSDHDGVSDYGDDLDGDGVSNAEEIARGTAEPRRTSAPSGAAGSQASEDTARDDDGDEPATGDEPGSDAPSDTPSGTPAEPPEEPKAEPPSGTPSLPPKEPPSEPPSDMPDPGGLCTKLREACAAGDTGACEGLKLQGCEQQPTTIDERTCDTLWARCVANQQRACQAFIGGCELPDCVELKVACGGGSEPLCALLEERCL